MENRKHAYGGGLPWLALGLFVTLTMALGLCPATGIAEELVDVGPDDAVAVVQGQGVETLSEEEPVVQVQNQNAEQYDVWVGGVQVDSEHTSGQVWSYDASKNTLTLNGYDNENQNDHCFSNGDLKEYASIYAKHNLTIHMTGANTVRRKAATVSSYFYGVCVRDGDLTIIGDGTLTASNSGYHAGIRVYNGNLTIESGEVTAYGQDDGIVAGTENDAGCNVQISGGTVNAYAVNNDCGISASGDVTISVGKVTAISGYAQYQPNQYGIYAGGNVTIEGGVVEATGNRFGIFAMKDNVTINGGEVIAKTTNNFDGWTAIYAQNGVTIGSGVVVEAGNDENSVVPITDLADFSIDHPQRYVHTKRLNLVIVAANPDGGGTVEASPTMADKDKTVTLTATPVDGYEFAGWTLDPTDTGATINNASSPKATLTVGTKDVTATANFQKKAVAVASVMLEPATATLAVGETKQLKATVRPDDATDKTVTWRSSNEGVAKVDGDGKVTAVSAGKATVTVTAGDKSGSCEITVTNKTDPIVPTGTGHLQQLADTPVRTSDKGIVIGTTGESRRLEAMRSAFPRTRTARFATAATCRAGAGPPGLTAARPAAPLARPEGSRPCRWN